ncbi:glycosyltransferase [Granulosicoccus sp.]|nr:glycosyltransferase [Granulosicoccus sp.]
MDVSDKELISGRSPSDSKNQLSDDKELIICFGNGEEKSNDGFLGNIDRVQDNLIQGWCINELLSPIKVAIELWIDTKKFSEIEASVYRQDLDDEGLQNGYCAFTLDIPELLLDDESYAGSVLKVIAKCGELENLMFSKEIGRGYLALSEVCLIHMSSEINRIISHEKIRKINNIDTVELELSSSTINDSGNPLFSCISNQNQNVGSAIKHRPNNISPYIIYSRDRFFRQQEVFRVEDNPDEFENLLVWYLESYGVHRKPRRVPLGLNEILYCNELLQFPNCDFRFSRYHFHFLLRNEPTTNFQEVLNDRNIYTSHLFSWVTNYLPVRNLEDVLIPEEYEQMLSTVVGQTSHADIAFNRFYEIAYHRTQSWHTFDISKSTHRYCIYFLGILKSIQEPSYFHFLPSFIKNEFIENGLYNFRKNLLESLDETSGKWLTEVDLPELLQKEFSGLRYSVKKSRYCTRDASGNRLDCSGVVVPSSLSKPNSSVVQLIGPLNKSSGLGQATRMSADALSNTGLPIRYVNFDLDNPAPVGFNEELSSEPLGLAAVNLIHLNAESIPLVFAYLPDVFKNSYNIGYFFWELDTPAKCHELALELLDEVWVSTEYGVTQYKGHSSIPVKNVGMTYETLEMPSKAECRSEVCSKFGIDQSSTIFLTTFDAMSFVQRKNPQAVIKAFKQAFNNGESVTLVLKTQNRDYVADSQQLRIWRSIESLVSNDQRIKLVNETMQYTDVLKLKKGADCYVSLHRSEGWGFGMIEAMNLETPVICTAYSGNLDFCSAETCWLVDYKVTFLGDWDYIFVRPGQKWAEPSIEHAASCMYEMHTNPQLSRKKCENAAEFISENYSVDAIGSRYGDRIREILVLEASKASDLDDSIRKA